MTMDVLFKGVFFGSKQSLARTSSVSKFTVTEKLLAITIGISSLKDLISASCSLLKPVVPMTQAMRLVAHARDSDIVGSGSEKEMATFAKEIIVEMSELSLIPPVNSCPSSG